MTVSVVMEWKGGWEEGGAPAPSAARCASWAQSLVVDDVAACIDI